MFVSEYYKLTLGYEGVILSNNNMAVGNFEAGCSYACCERERKPNST
jgi:hypothetical protein